MITSSNEITAPVNVVFQQDLLRTVQAYCPYFLGSSPGTISENSGTFTVLWRRIENLTPVTTALSEITGSVSFPTREGVRPTINDLSVAVQKYGNYIVLNEEVDLINYNGQSADLVMKLGINAGQSLNRLQRNELEDNSVAAFMGTATLVGNVVDVLATTGADIDRVVNLLRRQDALPFLPMTTGSTNVNTTPQRPAYWGINHPDVEMDIREMSGFVPVEQYASQTQVERGEIGSARGVRFVSSAESSIDADSGGAAGSSAPRYTTGTANLDIYNTVIMGMDHHGSVGLGFKHIKEVYNAGDNLPGVQMITKERGSAGSADPLNEISTLGWKSWHAAQVLTDSTTPSTGPWGYCLRSGASIL